jgi:transposase
MSITRPVPLQQSLMLMAMKDSPQAVQNRQVAKDAGCGSRRLILISQLATWSYASNDCSQAASLIAKVPDAEVIIADKRYDTEAIRARVEQQGSKVVIPRKRNSLKGNADLDKGLYRNRHLVENAFARLKHFRAVASRFDKPKRNYESVIAMACAFLWLPM